MSKFVLDANLSPETCRYLIDLDRTLVVLDESRVRIIRGQD